MILPSEQSIVSLWSRGDTKATLVELERMPATEEKMQIRRKYLQGEIGDYDFFYFAYRYLESNPTTRDKNNE